MRSRQLERVGAVELRRRPSTVDEAAHHGAAEEAKKVRRRRRRDRHRFRYVATFWLWSSTATFGSA